MTSGKNTSPLVSVVMRCMNSEWVIDRALAALYSQSYTDFELIVVDSGSTDRTLEIVRGYPCRLIEIEAGDYFPGAVLNSAIAKTSGELVVFQNSDSVPLTQHSLARLVEAFDDEEVQAAFGRQIPRPEAEDWVRRDYEASFPEFGPAPSWLTLSLPLAAFRRSVWERHHFYEDSWASEDTEWGKWAHDNNVRVDYVADATTMHSHNYTFKQIYGRRFVEGEADAFIYGGPDKFVKMLKRLVTSSVRDIHYEVRNRKWKKLWKTPFRRGVYQWAYYTGRRHGDRRSTNSDIDIATGQQVVLSRYQ